MAPAGVGPVMIGAYRAGVPGNGKPFPDGAKMAKIHWNPKKMETFPAATVPGTLHDVDFMVKDSKRVEDSGGWGWGAFEYDTASHTFTPAGTVAPITAMMVAARIYELLRTAQAPGVRTRVGLIGVQGPVAGGAGTEREARSHTLTETNR